MYMKEELIKFIETIPGEDGWWSYSETVFLRTAEKMLNKGFSESEVKEILEDMYSAVANCYGG
jgi:hypothetical protein